MFLAFTLFGSMPLVGYVGTAALPRVFGTAGEATFRLSVGITACTLFALGTVKSSFGAGIWWKAGAEVTAIGGIAAGVAYYTAQAVDTIVGGVGGGGRSG